MRIETVAQLLTIARGAGYIKKGKLLCKTARTPEEKAAAAAFKRVLTGTIVLVAVLIMGLAIVMSWSILNLESTGRIGTVQSDGQIRYIHNTPQYISQEELNLQQWNLQPGDEVYIYTDSVTDEVTGGMPCAVVEYRNNTRFGIMLGYIILMIVVLPVFALVICRLTVFGSAWYQYCLKQEKEDAEEIPPRVKLIINVIALGIAVLMCWSEITDLVHNIQKLQDVGAMAEAVQTAREEAQGYIDALEDLDVTVDVEDAADAADKIGDILDDLNP